MIILEVVANFGIKSSHGDNEHDKVMQICPIDVSCLCGVTSKLYSSGFAFIELISVVNIVNKVLSN